MERPPSLKFWGTRLSRLAATTGLALGALLLTAGESLASDGQRQFTISDVSVSRPFFNPSLGQKIGIFFALTEPGNLTVLILDRDGYAVRKLVTGKAIEKGKVSLDWDGRNDGDEVVPDEAYSLKIDLAGSSGPASYFPANFIAEPLPPRVANYDRLTGVVSYELPVSSRVHIQAGSAQIDKKTGKAQGPVLKTIANREPRAGGRVIETWNGWDESGTIRVYDLPHFAVGVAASPLPENSMITVGNRAATFFDWVLRRPGQSLLTAFDANHAHHRGQQSLEDVAPRLQLKPRNASWSATERLWTTSEKAIEVSTSVEGPTAKTFLKQPGKIMVFLDQKNVQNLAAGETAPVVRVSISGLTAGAHRITVDWVSDYGPVAVNSVLFRVERAGAAKTASRQEER